MVGSKYIFYEYQNDLLESEYEVEREKKGFEYIDYYLKQGEMLQDEPQQYYP